MDKTVLKDKLHNISEDLALLVNREGYDEELEETVNLLQTNIEQTAFDMSKAQVEMVFANATESLTQHYSDAPTNPMARTTVLKHGIKDPLSKLSIGFKQYMQGYSNERNVAICVAQLTQVLDDIAHNYSIIVEDGYVPEFFIPEYQSEVMPQIEEVKQFLRDAGIDVPQVDQIKETDGLDHINQRLNKTDYDSLGDGPA